MIINNYNIKEYQKKHYWKGIGTRSDPIIIDSIKDPYELLWFEKIDYNIILRNITIERINLKNSQNISIENSRIFEIWVDKSYYLSIINNSIYKIVLFEAKSCTIKGNKIHNPIREIEANYYAKLLDKFLIFFSFILIFISSIFLLHGLFENSEFLKSSRTTAFIISLFICSIIFLLFVFQRRYERRDIEKLPPNININNQTTNLTEEFKNFLKLKENLIKKI